MRYLMESFGETLQEPELNAEGTDIDLDYPFFKGIVTKFDQDNIIEEVVNDLSDVTQQKQQKSRQYH